MHRAYVHGEISWENIHSFIQTISIAPLQVHLKRRYRGKFKWKYPETIMSGGYVRIPLSRTIIIGSWRLGTARLGTERLGPDKSVPGLPGFHLIKNSFINPSSI